MDRFADLLKKGVEKSKLFPKLLELRTKILALPSSNEAMTYEPDDAAPLFRRGLDTPIAQEYKVLSIYLQCLTADFLELKKGRFFTSLLRRPYYCIVEKLVKEGRLSFGHSALMGLAQSNLYTFSSSSYSFLTLPFSTFTSSPR